MLESEAVSQLVCEATMDLGGRSDPKALVPVVSQHGQSCPLVRFDKSSFKSKPQRRAPSRTLLLVAAEFGRRRGHGGGSF